jgi:hypothetical protein
VLIVIRTFASRWGWRRKVRSLPIALLLTGMLPAVMATPAAAGGSPFSDFSASATNVPVGTTVTVTATTRADLGSDWIEIFELSTGALVGSCSGGTTCAATVSSSTTIVGRYQAWVTPMTSSLPTSLGTQSSEVDVTWGGILVALQASAIQNLDSATFAVTLTAFTNIDVGPTPYWIEIYNITTGAELGACGSSTACSELTVLPNGLYTFGAFVAPYSTTIPTSYQGVSPQVSAGT